jgi:hypothetical protein
VIRIILVSIELVSNNRDYDVQKYWGRILKGEILNESVTKIDVEMLVKLFGIPIGDTTLLPGRKI